MQSPVNENIDKIKVKTLITSILGKSKFILSFTIFFTVLASLYSIGITPTYKASTYITYPSDVSVAKINNLEYITVTEKSLLFDYLNLFSHKKEQKQFFNEGNFATKFNLDKNYLPLILIEEPKINQFEFMNGLSIDLPYELSIEGKDEIFIQEYLTKFKEFTNLKIINNLISLNDELILNRLEKIKLERKKYLNQAISNRLVRIIQLREENNLVIREIQAQIKNLKKSALVNRQNQIQTLSESLKLAKSLGIVENNFKVENEQNFSTNVITIGENKDSPEWFLYGEKALTERITLLVNRKNDAPFILGLSELTYQLDMAQNNSEILILELREDDTPFVPEIILLDTEKKYLESLMVNKKNGMNAMKSTQDIKLKTINITQRGVIFQTFLGSLIISILLSLMMVGLRPTKNTLT